MKSEVENIIENRPITEEDLEAYKGFDYKSDDACIFEQNKCTERDIFGHDSYERYCTRSGELKHTDSYVCEKKCPFKTTVKNYKSEKGLNSD